MNKTTIIGTNHFPSMIDAVRYYRPYHYQNTVDAVIGKIAAKEIVIGVPDTKEGETLILLDEMSRYGIVTKL